MLTEFYGQHVGSAGDARIVGPHQHLQLPGYLLFGLVGYLGHNPAHIGVEIGQILCGRDN